MGNIQAWSLARRAQRCSMRSSKMTDMFEETIQNLEQWSQQQKLIELALESCKVSLKNCAIEEAELFPTQNTGADVLRGHKLSDIQLHFDKQSLVFKHDILSYPYVEIQIGLYVADATGVYLRDLEPIGDYNLIVKLDGEIDDDYLVLSGQLREKE
jgi:hypothetical protein